MQRDPRYEDVVDEVKAFLEERLAFAVARASPRSACCSTPASASARRSSTTSSCCAASTSWRRSGRPLVVGTSRKSFLGPLIADAARRRASRSSRRSRLPGTIATNVLALERGASVFRVHDVAPVRAALAVAAATLGASDGRRRRRDEATSDDGEDEDGDEQERRGRRPRDERIDEDEDEAARVRHDRDHRPLALHPPRRQRGRARGRPAAGARPAPGRGRDRRHRHRSIEDTVDYAEVCQLVALVAQQRSHSTLERLCSTIADRLLADYELEGVWVKATKPEPPIPLPVERSRSRLARGARQWHRVASSLILDKLVSSHYNTDGHDRPSVAALADSRTPRRVLIGRGRRVPARRRPRRPGRRRS